MKRVIIATLAIAAVVGCTKQESGEFRDFGAADFSSTMVVGRLSTSSTTTDGSTWSGGDKIGISSDTGYKNVGYVAVVNGGKVSFNYESGQNILLPRSGVVNYTAYYPLQQVGDGVTHSVDLTDQSTLGAIDFLIAESRYDASTATSNNVELSFEHALSMLSFTINNSDQLPSLNGLKVELSGVATDLTYTFATEAFVSNAAATKITLNTIVESGDAKATAVAIVPPTIALDASAKLTFTVGTKVFEAPIALTPTKGCIHAYELVLGNKEVDFTRKNQITGWQNEAEYDFGDHGGLTKETEE